MPKDESLASLNTSYTKEGAYVYIPKGVCPEDPVQIMHISTGNQESIWLQPRNLIIADKNSKVEISEEDSVDVINGIFKHMVATNEVKAPASKTTDDSFLKNKEKEENTHDKSRNAYRARCEELNKKGVK